MSFVPFWWCCSYINYVVADVAAVAVVVGVDGA